MKRIMSVVGLLVLTNLSGFGQQEAAFFRIVSSTNSGITALSSDGTLSWTNAATAGLTCMIQRAATLAGPSNWVDYVQHGVTSATMTVRVYDPNPIAGMRLIPAGMNSGTDPDFGAYSLTNAVAFYMDATGVTKAKWDEVYTWAVTNGYTFVNAGSGKASNHPVQKVSWYDCVKWCNARSAKEGKTPCYNLSGWSCNFSANGYRLPTNTEWAYAARGGLSGKRFPWGDTIMHSQANYYSSTLSAYDTSLTRNYHPMYATGGTPYTSPAGAFAANGYGLYDMAGNVWEWCNDASGSDRSIRGGCWYDRASYARCGLSSWFAPDYAAIYYGFRSVCR